MENLEIEKYEESERIKEAKRIEEQIKWDTGFYETAEEKEAYELKLLRMRRKRECFDIYNWRRNAGGRFALTGQQRDELDAWHGAWCDAPDTGVIPQKPAWLK